MKTLSSIALLAACFVLGGLGKQPTPTTTSASAKVEPLSDAELKDLITGEPGKGITALREPLRVHPNHAQMLHAMGYLNLQLKRYPEAAKHLDKAAANTLDTYQLAFNRAFAALRSGNEVRSSSIAAAYLQAHQECADERLVTILGDSNARLRKGLSSKINGNIDGWESLYKSRLPAVEASKTGQRMWGSTWLDTAAYNDVSRRCAESQQRLADAERKLASATAERERADDAAKAAQDRLPDANQPRSRWREEERDNARNAARAAARDEAAAKTARDQAKRSLVGPAFDSAYSPRWTD